MKSILFLFLPFCFIWNLFAQQAFNWQNYSDQKNVARIALSSDGIWAATTGGAFFYTPSDKSFKFFHKEDGLSAASLTSVTIDKQGKVLFGSPGGVIDVFDPAAGSFKSILDISLNSSISNKRIYELKAYGDTVIVSTDYGISLINTSNFIFYDTYVKFASLPANTKVNSILKSNLLYVCTDNGIAVQKAGASNLSAPESWDLYTTGSGLPSNEVREAVLYNNSILAVTKNGLAVFNGIGWNSYLPEINSNIKDVSVIGDSIFILRDNTITVFNGNILTDIYSSAVQLNAIEYSDNFGLLAASANGIFTLTLPAEDNFIIPNGPQANQFFDLNVDRSGVLWVASGRDNSGVGFYKLENDTWTNFNVTNTPQLPTNAYHSVYTAPDNSTYFGNWGSGFIKIKNDNLTVFKVEDTPFQGIPGNPHFLVITDFAADSKNNLWVLNYGGSNRVNLAVLTPGSLWHSFINPAEGNLTLNQHFNLVVDRNNTKWYIVKDASRPGLYYFNENNTFNEPNDDFSGFLNSSSGLNNSAINSIVVDNRGDLWIGTTQGVNIITNTNAALSDNPSFRISSVFTLRQQTINVIAVDPLNQKWIGTNQGLLLVSPDGSRLLAVYDSKNSALLNDEIISIAVDENNGRIFAGTSLGLTSFDTPFIKPVESFDELNVYPSPYILNSQNKILTIDGLIKDSDIKILSVSGKLVYEFSSPGGRIAYWNGRDFDGKFVGSGVYLLVAFDKEGNSVTTQKVAVVRE